MPDLAREPAGEPVPASTSLLEEGARILNEIAELCAQHRAALAAHDSETLVALTERAETLSARFRLLESARQGIGGGESFSGEEPAIESEAREEARRQLSEAAATAALAASSCADLLARTSAATVALRRVIEGAASAGYLPNGDLRPARRSVLLEKRA